MLLALGVVRGARSRRHARARARSSTPPWSTAPPCLMTMFHGVQRDGHLGATSAARTCSTPAPTSTTCTRPPTASTCRSGRSSRSSTPSCSRLTGLEGEELPRQMDRAQWPALKERLAEIFKTKTRDEWCEIMEHTDVCFAPVLTLERGAAAPAQRRTAAPSSRSPASCSRRRRRGSAARRARSQRPPPHAGQHTDEVLAELGPRRRPHRQAARRPAPSPDRGAIRAAPLGCGPQGDHREGSAPWRRWRRCRDRSTWTTSGRRSCTSTSSC